MVMPQIQPAQRTLTYSVTPSSGAISFDIDIAKDLSAINRRLYRQGMQYLVSAISISRTDTGISGMTVLTAGDTWMVHNAWKKGFNLWRGQVNDALEALPGIEGKWADFKVNLDDNSGTAINTIASDSGTILPDEWNLSNYVWDDDGTERSPTFNLLGASTITGNIGLVQEYHISRSQVTRAPEVNADASDSIYAKSLDTDEMTDTIVDFLEGENDDAPYDMTEMVGGDSVADCPFIQDHIVANFASGKASSDPFTAECGLIRCQLMSFTNDGSTGSDVAHLVRVHLAPGDYKGVAAAPMGQ